VTVRTLAAYKETHVMSVKTPARRFRARGNGLSLSVVEWTPSASPEAPTCLLLHGFMDAAESFDLMAPALAAAGLRVLAPDLRGFGESDRVSGGGYYHFPDYVADVDALLAGGPDEVFVVGHSMGGTIATLFAGAKPERVKKLAVLEGLGPLDTPDDAAPLRVRKWLDDLTSPPTSQPMTEDDALRRLVAAHPRVPREVLATRLVHLARAEGDGLVWRYDPLHRTTAPMPFLAKVHGAFAARVECPVLYVTGGPLGWRVPDEDARVACFADVTRTDLEHAGHMMHWSMPVELAETLIRFLR
jgi:pimeloyl-ACP methyl ester carboxylesterase